MPALGIARLRRRAESSGQGLPCMGPAAGLRTWASTWPGTSVACTSPRAARSPPAVYVRLRGDAAYDLASMHDVAVCEWRCCAAAQLQRARAARARRALKRWRGPHQLQPAEALSAPAANASAPSCRHRQQQPDSGGRKDGVGVHKPAVPALGRPAGQPQGRARGAGLRGAAQRALRRHRDRVRPGACWACWACCVGAGGCGYLPGAGGAGRDSCTPRFPACCAWMLAHAGPPAVYHPPPATPSRRPRAGPRAPPTCSAWRRCS